MYRWVIIGSWFVVRKNTAVWWLISQTNMAKPEKQEQE
jgi:hypothetical protein